MAFKAGKRLGGRGCPECGSHDTESMGRAGSATWCNSCGHRWIPCKPGCRGYDFDMNLRLGPTVIGCKECQVPDRVARQWPEDHRALANRLVANQGEDYRTESLTK